MTAVDRADRTIEKGPKLGVLADFGWWGVARHREANILCVEWWGGEDEHNFLEVPVSACQ